MLSPQKAADRAGVSRKSVMDAIKAEKLRAVQSNEDRRWQIDPASLEAWMESRSNRQVAVTSDETPDESTSPGAVEVARLEERLQAATTRMAELEERVAHLTQDRDEARAEVRAERERADQAHDAIAEMAREAQRKRSLWEILTGKAWQYRSPQ